MFFSISTASSELLSHGVRNGPAKLCRTFFALLPCDRLARNHLDGLLWTLNFGENVLRHCKETYFRYGIHSISRTYQGEDVNGKNSGEHWLPWQQEGCICKTLTCDKSRFERSTRKLFVHMDRSNRGEQFMHEMFFGSSCTFPYIKHGNVCLLQALCVAK